ncbi:hypothetical protein BGZ65_013038, partial [Modicella reniformis]
MLKASDFAPSSGKVTKDMLAFLNRKTHSSAGGTDNELEKTPQHIPHESSLFPQANSTRRAPFHDTIGDGAIVEHHQHLFENQLNKEHNQLFQQQHRHISYSSNNHRHASRSARSRSHKQGSPPQPPPRQQIHSDVDKSLHTEQERAQAQEQLRTVRKTLRRCAPDSTYFRRFAALADDWRNFLPHGGAVKTYDDKDHARNNCGIRDIGNATWRGPQNFDISGTQSEVETDSDREGFETFRVINTKHWRESSNTQYHDSQGTVSSRSNFVSASNRDVTDTNDTSSNDQIADSLFGREGVLSRRTNDQRGDGVFSKKNCQQSCKSGTSQNYGRSPSGKNGTHYSLQQPLQHQMHYGYTKLEDVIRGIESEFSLCFDDSDGTESEDSLTCLIPGYGSCDNDDQIGPRALYRSDGTFASTQPSQARAKSRSPALAQTTIDSIKSVCFLSSEDEPPQYGLHEQDQPLSIPCNAFTSVQGQQIINSTSAVALTGLVDFAENEEKEKTEIHKSGSKNTRPLLRLRTETVGGIAPGALSAFEKKPLGSQFPLTKCNSTSSLYIDSTMTKSDAEETIRAVATVLYDKILESHRLNDYRTEKTINSSSYVPSEKVIVTRADIFEFMRFIFECGQNLGPENAIITLIYVERMTDLGNLSFHAINWRRLLLGALVLSIKVWEDLAVFNSDVCAIFEGLSVKDVNELERFSMAKLQYNVSVRRSVYAAYYFRLREISEQQHNEQYGRLKLKSQRGSNVSRFRSESNAGLLGMSLGMAGSSSHSLPCTHHHKVPIGPGYRKWTLKPLSVREADRLEARSSFYTSTLMMEAQERQDAGCSLDEHSCATPEELYSFSVVAL